MTITQKIYLLLLSLIGFVPVVNAQQGASEFESNRISATLPGGSATGLAGVLIPGSSDAAVFAQLQTAFSRTGGLAPIGTSPDFAKVRDEVSNTLTTIENDGNAAVILIYRNLTTTTNANGKTFAPDFTKMTEKVFHKGKQVKKVDGTTALTFSNYLLATKTVYIIFVDVDASYYLDDKDNKPYQFSSATTKINYRTNQFNQSFKDLAAIEKAAGSPQSKTLELTIVKIKASRVKDPCDIVISHPKFDKDLTYTIHEVNIATFQVGVTGSKLNLNNVSITGGDLVIKPSTDQQTSWKSNAYALLELHLPRDVDNFRPILQSIFSRADTSVARTPGQWLMENTLDRIGIYGGLKIGKDPLSSLYAGFNYALSKQLALNFGWEWINDYATQVTDIGSITSLSDALSYAKRRYSKGVFSVGISFSPSYFSSLIGTKTTSADAGN